jgi:branched-chain amino acid transport system permease protein
MTAPKRILREPGRQLKCIRAGVQRANNAIFRIFRSLQQNEDLARSIGVDVARYRVMAYAVCCFLGGLGGSYFAVAQQSIYPNVFGVPDSIFFILYCFLGGLAYVAGPVVGTFILFVAFEILHPLQQYQQLIYAALMIGIMLCLPNGLLSLSWSGAGQAPVSGT